MVKLVNTYRCESDSSDNDKFTDTGSNPVLTTKTKKEMRRLVLVSAYNRFNVPLTEDDMCIIETRDSNTEITINEAIDKFSATTTSSGILDSYIFDTETKVSTRIPTQWDSVRLRQRDTQRRLITQQIERLQEQLITYDRHIQ